MTAVFQIADIRGAGRAELHVVRVVAARGALVDQFRLVSPGVVVHRGLYGEDADAAYAILQVFRIVTFVAILGIIQMIAGRTLVVLVLESFVRLRREEVVRFLTHRLHSFVRIQFQRRFLLLVFFFRQLFVQNHVLLLPLVNASDAITTTDTVIQEKTVAAVLAFATGV